jgi:type II secretory pathway component PulJ
MIGEDEGWSQQVNATLAQVLREQEALRRRVAALEAALARVAGALQRPGAPPAPDEAEAEGQGVGPLLRGERLARAEQG